VVEKDVDILIVGGGLAGASLMLALANSGYSTLLVEAKPFSDRVKPSFDARTLALAPASVQILNMLSIWPHLQADATPIETIHVSERYSFGTARLKAIPGEALGYVVEMQHINKALYPLLEQQPILAPAELTGLDPDAQVATIATSTGDLRVHAKLIVAADGLASSVRQYCNLPIQEKHYGQHAIVANIGLTRSHQNQAYERFTNAGPLALLPMSGLRASMVWALHPEEATQLAHVPEATFLKALQIAFGYRLGRFVRVGERVVYPLKQVIMPQQVKGGIVFVGNAAHTLHPVAGQGFNLGLRDVATLAQCIVQKGLGADMLEDYQQARRHDQAAIARFTDGLIQLYTTNVPGLGLIRSAGLMAIDHLPLFKGVLARYARGFAGMTPDLVCGIPLRSVHESSL
jgi:2-octaprenyl-6-methoxyphenol hydroxylase